MTVTMYTLHRPFLSYELFHNMSYLYIDALILVLNMIFVTTCRCKTTSNDLIGTLIYARVISLTSFLLELCKG